MQAKNRWYKSLTEKSDDAFFSGSYKHTCFSVVGIRSCMKHPNIHGYHGQIDSDFIDYVDNFFSFKTESSCDSESKKKL